MHANGHGAGLPDRLPPAERDAWRKLWADVDDLLKRVSDNK
jgi:hypothetical protein